MNHKIAIADLFCGAGGTSTGAVEAIEMLGYKADLTAINHWPVAIATHTKNHPGARHFTTSIDDINPRNLFNEGELDLLWASPECMHHSSARGGKPINDQSRATAWCVVRWAEALRPNTILVENVPEFVTWGPIGSNGRPLKKRKGEIFRAWKTVLESLGYRVEHKILCAADYGDPTTRRRLFVQAVRGKRKIVWPDPTHSPKEQVDIFSARRPWVPARDIIDWNLKGQSIYDRKKPLSDKTMRRIMVGLKKFGLKPFMVPQNSSQATRDVDKPAPTLTTTSRGVGVAEPYLVNMKGQSDAASIEKPAPTVTAHAEHLYLAEPFLAKLRGTNNAADINNPCPTVTAGGTQLAVVEPYLAHGNVKDPNGDDRRSRSINEALPAICGNRGDWALCEPSLLPQHAGGMLRPVSKPSPTVTTDGAIGLVEPFIVPIDHTGRANTPANSINNPLTTVTTENRHALVEPFLVKYYGTANAEGIDRPLDTVTSKSRFGLVEIDGNQFAIDIRFRMLQPHELAAAQGFRSDYKFAGNKTEQVKQIGNAVPRNLARAIVLASLSQQSDISQFFQEEMAA